MKGLRTTGVIMMIGAVAILLGLPGLALSTPDTPDSIVGTSMILAFAGYFCMVLGAPSLLLYAYRVLTRGAVIEDWRFQHAGQPHDVVARVRRGTLEILLDNEVVTSKKEGLFLAALRGEYAFPVGDTQAAVRVTGTSVPLVRAKLHIDGREVPPGITAS